MKQLNGCHGVRPNGRLGGLAYVDGKVEGRRALLTANQKVELVADVKVKVTADAVEGKAVVATPAAKVNQGRKETQPR